MASLIPKSIRDLGIYGVIRSAEVDDHVIPDGAVTEANNVQFDRKGAVVLRGGITGLGGTIKSGQRIYGLASFQGGTMIASVGGTLYTYHGGAWNGALVNQTTATKSRFVDFAGRTIFIGGAADSMRAWSGIDDTDGYWEWSGNPINAKSLNVNSIYPRYGEVYKSRVYVAGDATKPDRLYFSAVIDSSGNLSWSPTVDYVDINPSDGEHITALKRYSLELCVFKPNYIYRFRTSGIDPDPLIRIGTSSQESIVEGKKGLYFHHETGFYQYSGGYPTDISRPISDFVSAIPYTSYADITAWKDNDHIYWFIGDVTINEPLVENVSWKNVVCRYTESCQVWTVYSLPWPVYAAAQYNNGTNIVQLVGASNGTVGTFGSGTTDFGEPIKYRFITKWYELDGIVNRKVIQNIMAFCEKAQASTLFYQVDGKMEWQALGQLDGWKTMFDSIAIKCQRIRFKITGVSSVEPFVFLGLEIPVGINEGIIKD